MLVKASSLLSSVLPLFYQDVIGARLLAFVDQLLILVSLWRLADSSHLSKRFA